MFTKRCALFVYGYFLIEKKSVCPIYFTGLPIEFKCVRVKLAFLFCEKS